MREETDDERGNDASRSRRPPELGHTRVVECAISNDRSLRTCQLDTGGFSSLAGGILKKSTARARSRTPPGARLGPPCVDALAPPRAHGRGAARTSRDGARLEPRGRPRDGLARLIGRAGRRPAEAERRSRARAPSRRGPSRALAPPRARRDRRPRVVARPERDASGLGARARAGRLLVLRVYRFAIAVSRVVPGRRRHSRGHVRRGPRRARVPRGERRVRRRLRRRELERRRGDGEHPDQLLRHPQPLPRARLPRGDRGGVRRRDPARARGRLQRLVPRRARRPRRRRRAGHLRPRAPRGARVRPEERAAHPRPGLAARRRVGAHARSRRARGGDRVRARVPRSRQVQGRAKRHHPQRRPRALRTQPQRPHERAPARRRGVRAPRHREPDSRRRGGAAILAGTPGHHQPHALRDGSRVRHRAHRHAARGAEGAPRRGDGAAPDPLGGRGRRPGRPRRVRDGGEQASDGEGDRGPVPGGPRARPRGRGGGVPVRDRAHRRGVQGASPHAHRGRGRDARAARGGGVPGGDGGEGAG